MKGKTAINGEYGHRNRIMKLLYVLLILCLCFAFLVTGNDMADEHITINTRTGFVSLSSLPQIALPGDEIMVCNPPGYSEACQLMSDGICMVSENPCQTLQVPTSLPHDSLALLTPQRSIFKANKVQPTTDPVVHCLLMFDKNTDLLDMCVRQLMRFNTTLGPADDTVFHKPMQVSIWVRHPIYSVGKNELAKWMAFAAQFTLFTICATLFLLKAQLLTLF